MNCVLHRAQVSVGGRKSSHSKLNEREVPSCVRTGKLELIGLDFIEHLQCEILGSSELALQREAVGDGKHHARAGAWILNLWKDA